MLSMSLEVDVCVFVFCVFCLTVCCCFCPGGAIFVYSLIQSGALGLATASVQVLQSSFQSNMVLAPSNTAVTGLNTNGGGCMSIVLFFSFTDFVNYIGAIYVLCSSYLAGQVSFMSLNATTVLSMPP